MTAAALRRAPLSVSDRRVLLSVSEAQAGPRATVSGSTEVSAASGMPARPTPTTTRWWPHPASARNGTPGTTPGTTGTRTSATVRERGQAGPRRCR